ncbi:competence protein ComGB [Enterococcus sp. DIV0840]|uniref:competence type IV pilus assembly protein ComGB n=1 Tax=Enterococcus TaxID=1350 RepID=UPI001A90B6F2|nr:MULTISPECIES: competence type IV pilus assembly protein ComGB [Enterococcus]MBO0435709.1 type II secretion system F family protein [Enterococcus sp. DIV0849a]MBO0474341.1 type II secretion system F family protein [Enterococcus ureasiticus]
MDLSIIKRLKKKKSTKLSSQQQQLFIQLLADLLSNGFTIQESLMFMRKSRSISEVTIDYLIHIMERGDSLHGGLAQLGFKTSIITQIEFAQTHGDITGTLKKIKQHMKIVDRQQQNFYKVISYPLLLLLFLTVVLISIRQVLLPQLMTNGTIQVDNIGIKFIQQSPYYILAIIFGLTSVILLMRWYLSKRTFLQRAEFVSKIPIVGKLFREYNSAFFALEWGRLFSQGLEIKMIIQLMQGADQQSLMSELAEMIEERSMLGHTFYEQLPRFTFFSPELSLIIQQGQVKGNLGKELILYSELCWQRFFKRMEKMIQWIQPIIFLVVALLVVSIYAAMLLPIYGGMEEFL